MTAENSLTVVEVLSRLREVVVSGFPSPIWVRGEVTGFRRTSGGAVFFRLADPDDPEQSLDVAARGVVMAGVDRALSGAGLGGLRDGVEVRLKGTVGVDQRHSVVRLSLLEVDPSFTAGRLAIDREEVLRRMRADGTLRANAAHPLPPVPLRVGLVTSRGSAAHADFIDQLRGSGYRFAVRTAHTRVQGDLAAESIVAALGRFDASFDMVALVRGGGSRLDLAVFDSESVARAVAAMPIPVITGIGHDIDHTVADEVAAVSMKTPSAAGQWLIGRVEDFAIRIATARHAIQDEARSALQRSTQTLRHAAAGIAASRTALARRRDNLDSLADQLAGSARTALARHDHLLRSMTDLFQAVNVESTLNRGFSLVTKEDGSGVVRSVNQVTTGERLLVRLSDGTVKVKVEE
jgi:exodeoxyribonuclease VII large subunit